MPDLIDAIDERIAAKTGDVLVEGIIVSVAPRYIRIKLTGSSRTVTAFYDSGMSLEAGKRAFITWSKQQARYVVLASIDAPGSQSATSNRNPADFQLAPPSNVAAVALPNAILVKWDDPIVQVLAYEIQSNSSATDVGATTELVTRGMFLKSATVQTYLRVRSITTDYRYSSWSAWVNATPQTIYTTLVSLTDVNIPTPSDGDIPTWDAATSKWIAGMAGMFSGTATDVPYTMTDPSDWTGTPTNVGDALDELAATGGGGGGGLPTFGAAVSKTLSSDVVAAGADRHLIISAESGTADNLIEITGLGVGNEVVIRAASGHTITVKHNSGSATDKILLHDAADLALSGDKVLKLFKSESGKVVQYVEHNLPSPSQWVNTTTENMSGAYAAFTNSAEGTFVAPPSGKVYITVSGRMNIGNTQHFGYTSWELREGSSIGSGTQVLAADDNRAIRGGNTVTTGAPFYGQGSHRYLVTGLTAGSTYNVRTMRRASTTISSEFRALLVEPVL